MKPQTAFAILSSALIGQVFCQEAPEVDDNPVGVTYLATLPKDRFFKDAALDGNVKGSISASAADGGKGVKFKVKFENLPKEGGPFGYHIHVEPAAGGNCTTTLAHLDPFARGEEPVCDSTTPANCQVGDLSGKHGKITQDPFETEYVDLYASTKEGIGAFFGNRSFVLHYANKTRLTCADFQMGTSSNGSYPQPSSTATGTGVKPSGTTEPTSVPTFVNAAVSNILSGPLALAGMAVVAFAL
ncbi:Fc.00g065040.m01.CDS01 [Cosmosporella sp. VM-42]